MCDIHVRSVAIARVNLSMKVMKVMKVMSKSETKAYGEVLKIQNVLVCEDWCDVGRMS